MARARYGALIELVIGSGSGMFFGMEPGERPARRVDWLSGQRDVQRSRRSRRRRDRGRRRGRRLTTGAKQVRTSADSTDTAGGAEPGALTPGLRPSHLP